MSKWYLLIFRLHVQRLKSNHSFEPTVLSAQYPWSIPNLVQGLRLMRKWSLLIFRSHVFKGQGQTTLLSQLCCPLNTFYHFTCSIPNLVQGLPLMSRWSILIFRSHVQRSRPDHCVLRSIIFYPFTCSIPNLVQGLRPMRRWSLLIFRLHVPRSNHFCEPSVLSAQYLLTLHLIKTKLGAGVKPNK